MVDGLYIAPVQQNTEETRVRRLVSVEQERFSERAVREAESILTAGKVKGSEALRIRALIQQAKVSTQTGKPTEAQRLARQALHVARKLGDLTGITPLDSEDENAQPAPDTGNVATATPALRQAQDVGEQDSPSAQSDRSVYRDSREDGDGSLQTGAPLSELEAPLAVRSHETSHLHHEIQEAVLEGRRVDADIRIPSRTDSDTGHQETAGGRATVVTFPNTEPVEPEEHKLNVKA
jgi:hypothetical protein